jgi:hypothetical protein
MKEICWIEVGNSHVAELQYGRLVISPTAPANPHRPYTARIETSSGKMVAAAEYDLEGCKSWASVNLPLMDEVSGELGDCGKAVETLALCQHLLPTETDAAYWLRIEYIKLWMAKRTGQTYEVVDIPLPEFSYDSLNWVEQGTELIADTPHGRAVIHELQQKGVIGERSQHKARIIHRSGAKLDCYSWVDFAEAESAIKKQLKAMDRPDICESHLDIMHFTLDVCKEILPVDADPIHYARLDMLGSRIHLALD